jgi:anti-sigma factor RsiW
VTSSELTCQELVELITDYFEGALPPHERQRFETHLTHCDGCTNYVEQIRILLRLSERLTETMIPSDARRELLAVFRDWNQKQ